MFTQFDQVRIGKQAHIDAGGHCIGYDLAFPGHSRKMLGVMLPPRAVLNADGGEVLEIVNGTCRVRVGMEGAWQELEGGRDCPVPAGCQIEIEAEQPVHYVRHFQQE